MSLYFAIVVCLEIWKSTRNRPVEVHSSPLVLPVFLLWIWIRFILVFQRGHQKSITVQWWNYKHVVIETRYSNAYNRQRWVLPFCFCVHWKSGLSHNYVLDFSVEQRLSKFKIMFDYVNYKYVERFRFFSSQIRQMNRWNALATEMNEFTLNT